MTDWNLIVTDLDGTLLDDRGRVDPRNAAALKTLTDHGVNVVVATGRTHLMLREIIAELDVALPVVACNGALIRDMATGEMLLEQTIPDDKVRELIEFCRARDRHILFYTMDAIFFNAGNTRIERFERYNEAAEAHLRIPLHPDSEWLAAPEDRPVVKMLIHDEDPEVFAEAERICNADGRLYMVSSAKGLLDIMAAGCTKGEGLRHLAGLKGWDLGKAAVFGDNHNDLSMFEVCGTAIAVANAEPEVLAAASRIAPSNVDCGVAVMLAEMFPDWFQGVLLNRPR